MGREYRDPDDDSKRLTITLDTEDFELYIAQAAVARNVDDAQFASLQEAIRNGSLTPGQEATKQAIVTDAWILACRAEKETDR